MRQSLCERLQDLNDDQTKAELILNLSKRTVLASGNSECLVTMLHSEANLLVQFSAARTLTQSESPGAADHVVPVFLRLIRHAKPLVQAYKPIALRSYDAIDEIAICLCLVGREQATTILPVLLDVLDRYTGFNSAMIAHTLLYLALNGKAVTEGIHFRQMTQEQQQVLLRITQSTRAWRYSGNMAETLAFFGLPTTKEAFNKFYGSN